MIEERTLPRVLGPIEALCVVVGCVIGSGIFIVPAEVARNVPALGPIVLVWIVGGVFSAAGALTLAELGAMLPQAGGPYVYLRAAYGMLPAFLFGWTEFLVIRTGSMATLAAAFSRYFVQVCPPMAGISHDLWQALAAAGAIAVVTAVNILGTTWGGRLQVLGTVLKVGGVLTLIALPLVLGAGDPARLSLAVPAGFHTSMAGLLAAMVGVLWAYDGWVNLTPLAEEVREPGRNVPLAMILGMAVLIVLYISVTVVYHYVLPMETVAAARTDQGANKAVAAVYCYQLLGKRGVLAISLLVMCSTFISLNGNALTGPRAYFAMARDRLFPAALCRIHPRFQTPANAVLLQGAWAILLTVAATALILVPAPSSSGLPGPFVAAWSKLNKTPLYEVLYTYVIFGANLFYLLTITGVFVLRKRHPDWPRPYRTWGYPLTPILYVIGALVLLGNMLAERPAESLSGLAIIALGLPAYLVFRRAATAEEHTMLAALLTVLLTVEPITPSQLQDALQVPPRGDAAEALAVRIRAAFPGGTDLKLGARPLVDGSIVAFIVEADATPSRPPRVTGMVNHGRGYDLVAIGETGLWARVEMIANDTKFAYSYSIGDRTFGRGTVEMPQWKYPPESSEQPGRSYGKAIPLAFRSAVFNNKRTGAIYVPAAYKPEGPPAALMVFQDGDAYLKEHVGTVVDNLIAARQMPVTILLLLNPGTNDDNTSNRSVEYDTLSDRYVKFLETEAIPLVAKDYKLRPDADSRAIGGASSGAICAFTAAWNRPDLFGRVCSQIGSFTNIRGGDAYPELIRKSPPKPIKVFLADGTNDLINQYGDWWQANEAMAAALREKGYAVDFLQDRGFHAYWTCGRQLPEALRRTWAQ